MKTHRLFIAIAVPEPVKDAVQAAQEALRPAVPGGAIRWTKRDQFHLTLRFLGDVEILRVEALAETVRRLCTSFRPVTLCAERIGFFPEARFPRVVWAGVKDVGRELSALQGAIQSAAAGFTSEKPEGTFTGHLTLGRVRSLSRQQAETLAAAAHGMEDRCFGEWVAGEVHLIRSELTPDGARHTAVTAFQLGPFERFD